MHFYRSFVSVQQRSKSIRTILSFDSFCLTLLHPGLPLSCILSIRSYQAFTAPTFVSQYFQLSLSILYPWTPELFPVSSDSSHRLSSYLFIFHCSTFSDRSFWNTFFSTSAYRSALTPFTVTLLICKISLVVQRSFSDSSCSSQSLSCIGLSGLFSSCEFVREAHCIPCLIFLWWFEFRSFLDLIIIYAIDLTVFFSSSFSLLHARRRIHPVLPGHIRPLLVSWRTTWQKYSLCILSFCFPCVLLRTLLCYLSVTSFRFRWHQLASLRFFSLQLTYDFDSYALTFECPFLTCS